MILNKLLISLFFFLISFNQTTIAMFFQHVYDKTLAQGSFVIGCQATGEAIVIDAKRDVGVYLQIAKQNGLKITHLTETHIHADFLTGTRELAAVTGAKMYLSDEGGPDWQYEFPHEGLKNGDIIKVGNLSLEVMHTPGHTPESISFLLRDHPATDEPVMFFTGDFVFVGDVGRPDLLEKAAGLTGTQEIGAKQMYQSLEKFKNLPPHVQVWPGHGAGSACGKALGAVPSSTIGYELIHNWALKYDDDKQGFVDNLLSGQPEPPKYFAMMKKLNKVERPLMTEIPDHPRLDKQAFLDAYHRGVAVIDARERSVSEQGAIPGSLIIPNNNTFSTWAGWVVDYDKEIILITDSAQVKDLTTKLMSIGLDNVIGYISDVESLGLPLEKSDVINIEEFKSYLNRPDVQVVDVRNVGEYEEGHIEGVDHVFVGTIGKNLDKFDASKQIVIHCQSGHRAAIANSVLSANGIKNVKIYSGGMNEWLSQKNPVVSNK